MTNLQNSTTLALFYRIQEQDPEPLILICETIKEAKIMEYEVCKKYVEWKRDGAFPFLKPFITTIDGNTLTFELAETRAMKDIKAKAKWRDELR